MQSQNQSTAIRTAAAAEPADPTIADGAGGYAALTLHSESSEALTVEYKISLVAPAVGTNSMRLRAERR